MQSLLAIADPTRRRIVELLAVRERTAGELVEEFDMSAPAISQHLKVLKQAHFVRARVDGQHRIYELDPAGFTELENWLGGVRQFWQSRLDRLESELRKKNRRHSKKGSGHER